jgi:SRSO17 transposase
MPKQGKHSAGVARQSCGNLGKRDNSDVRRQGFWQ